MKKNTSFVLYILLFTVVFVFHFYNMFLIFTLYTGNIFY